MRERISDVEEDCCEIWPDNQKTVQFFFAICKQWIVSSMGDYLGLDNKAVEATMNMMGIPRRKRRKLLYEIGVMEEAAMKVFKERRKNECQR